MKIQFVSNKPLNNILSKTRKYTVGGGYGKALAGGLFKAEKGRPTKLHKAGNVELAVKIQPTLSDEKVHQLNDEQIAQFYAYKEFLAQTYSALDGSQPIKMMFNELQKSLLKQQKAVEEIYQLIHHQKPQLESSAGKKISIQHLSKVYIAYVSDTGVSEPKQEELFEFSKISQSTWSRTLRDLAFWKSVNTRIDNLWNTSSVVKDKIEKLDAKSRSNKERPILENLLSDKDYVLQENMDKIISPFELKRISTLPRNTMIKEIIKLHPTTKSADWDGCSDEILRRVLIAVTA